jgi:hypothetical protein
MSELDLGPIKKLLEDFTWEDFAPMVAHQYLIDCVAEVGRLHSDRASVRRDALLEAAKVNCQRCKNGDKLVSKQGKYYLHRIDVEGSNDYVDVNCDSEEIHQLIEADQGQGGERS